MHQAETHGTARNLEPYGTKETPWNHMDLHGTILKHKEPMEPHGDTRTTEKESFYLDFRSSSACRMKNKLIIINPTLLFMSIKIVFTMRMQCVCEES